VPPIPGIDRVDYHVLRTLDDATRLRAAMAASKNAVVLGAGLVGMHAAENLVKAGASVTIVEMSKQLTSGYFDEVAAGMIEQAFLGNGAKIRTGHRVVGLEPSADGATLQLDNGDTIPTDLLLVAVGVRPELGYLDGSGIATERGILVDDTMRTSAEDVWSAGDCAQARGFFTGTPVMNAILPDATVQGRIAGMAMADDPGSSPTRAACRSTPTTSSAATRSRWAAPRSPRADARRCASTPRADATCARCSTATSA
jgi:phenylglyoxylate dehydrogenase epsilon subunit